MAKTKSNRPAARLPRGFADREPGELRAIEAMLAKIARVYETYGFEPVETPLVEYTDSLGKFLPDQDRPNEGVFSFRDDDEQWLSLRYDLTAPLARYVAENYERLPKPYRSYRSGYVLRNEKPGPGRFRQFMQFDADTVGSSSPAADAEICMMAADCMEALGLSRSDYAIRVSSRRLLDGVMDTLDIPGEKRLSVLRSIDAFDRIGEEGTKARLGSGREDESGDFTPGAGLEDNQISRLFDLITYSPPLRDSTEWGVTPQDQDVYDSVRDKSGAESLLFYKNKDVLDELKDEFAGSETVQEALAELEAINNILEGVGFGVDRIRIDPSVVRGLEYYTGAVFEAELLFEVPNEKGQPVVFGSVGGGGRYDGLVGRFRGEDVPATGFSVGVSRLAAALKAKGLLDEEAARVPLVVVTVMDRDRVADYQRITSTLREQLNRDVDHDGRRVGVEMYVGASGLKAQMKYADRRGAVAAIIQGSDERERGVVQVKDLALGKRLSDEVEDREAWTSERPAQFEVPVDDLAASLRPLLDEGHGAG